MAATLLMGDSYRIGPGDLLSIGVFGEEDLSLPKVRVASNGTISFPLLGEIPVQGITSKELEQEITRRLLDGYLKKPTVTASILEYRMFYVNGEVKRPGGYNFVQGLTVEKAITLAGGFTERASKKKVTLQREADATEHEKPVAMNITVKPGDIISVGESFF